MACEHEDSGLCEQLGRHLTGRTFDIWHGRGVSAEKARKYRERWIAESPLGNRDGLRKMVALAEKRPCVHRGEAADTVTCQTCKGNWQIKTFACSVHGRCTLAKRVEGVAGCCNDASQPCTDYKPAPDPVTVNQGAGGLGDALLGSCAIVGLAKLHANRPVVYKTHQSTHQFLRLFDLGPNVALGVHDWDNGNERPKGDPHPGDMQMNTGYAYELQTRGRFSRLMRNCRNIGGVIPELPTMKDRAAIAAHGADFAGAVVLAPFSTWRTREYPLQHWLTLERLLREHGYRVVVLDAPNPNFPDRHKPLKSEIVYNQPADRVAGILLSSAMLIGNDSGLAHLAGIMGVPTLVLCGQVTGPDVYGFYGPHVHYLDGHLDCKGCWWQSPFSKACEPTCPDLASITPAEILSEVQRIAGPPMVVTITSQAKLENMCRFLPEAPEGCVVEVGLYKGGSLRHLASKNPSRQCYGYDTFAGLPDAGGRDNIHKGGDFTATLEEVQDNLSGLDNIRLIEGRYPESAMDHRPIALAHVDVDLYDSTYAAFLHLAPMMAPGGRIYCDDAFVGSCEGATMAACRFCHETGKQPSMDTGGHFYVQF